MLPLTSLLMLRPHSIWKVKTTHTRLTFVPCHKRESFNTIRSRSQFQVLIAFHRNTNTEAEIKLNSNLIQNISIDNNTISIRSLDFYQLVSLQVPLKHNTNFYAKLKYITMVWSKHTSLTNGKGSRKKKIPISSGYSHNTITFRHSKKSEQACRITHLLSWLLSLSSKNF